MSGSVPRPPGHHLVPASRRPERCHPRALSTAEPSSGGLEPPPSSAPSARARASGGRGPADGGRRPRSTALLPQGYDFDEVYDRLGDGPARSGTVPVATYGEHIEVGTWGSRTWRPSAPRRASPRRSPERCAHENWGYLRRPAAYIEAIVEWNRRRYGLEIDPETVELTHRRPHPGLIAGLHAFSPPGSRVLLTAPVYSGFYSDIRFTRNRPRGQPDAPRSTDATRWTSTISRGGPSGRTSSSSATRRKPHGQLLVGGRHDPDGARSASSTTSLSSPTRSTATS